MTTTTERRHHVCRNDRGIRINQIRLGSFAAWVIVIGLASSVSAQDDFDWKSVGGLHQSFENLLAQDTLRLEPIETDDATESGEASQGGAADNSSADDNEQEKQDDVDQAEGGTADQQRRELALSHLLKLRKPITQIRIGSGRDADDKRPPNRADSVLSTQLPGIVTATGASWQPPSRYPVAFWHRPLYYQQPDLERCGRTFQCESKQAGCLQNTVSGFTFLVNTMVLPYRIATERPDCLIPHQGDCRTCSTTGYDIEPLHPGRCGWVSEAAAIAGFTFLLL